MQPHQEKLLRRKPSASFVIRIEKRLDINVNRIATPHYFEKGSLFFCLVQDGGCERELQYWVKAAMIPNGGMLWRSLFEDRVEEDISDFCGQHISTVITLNL